VLKDHSEESAGFRDSPRSPSWTCCSCGRALAAADIFYSNPVKSRDHIAYAAAKGVEWFVIDSLEELKKTIRIQGGRQAVTCARHAQHRPATGPSPASSRHTSKCATSWPRRRSSRPTSRESLSRRLPVPQPGELARRHRESARRGSTHMSKVGLNPRLLNIGGGFSRRHVKPIPRSRCAAKW